MAMLGKWEEAASDLHVASKLDHDEEIGSVLKRVLLLSLELLSEFLIGEMNILAELFLATCDLKGGTKCSQNRTAQEKV